jgi:hypothetical protein
MSKFSAADARELPVAERLQLVEDCGDTIAAEQGVSEEEALKKGLKEKTREFVAKGGELYANG